MNSKRIWEVRGFCELRACWMILRGGSVAWRIGFRSDGPAVTLRPRSYIYGCQVDGEPLTIDDVWHDDPEDQPA